MKMTVIQMITADAAITAMTSNTGQNNKRKNHTVLLQLPVFKLFTSRDSESWYCFQCVCLCVGVGVCQETKKCFKRHVFCGHNKWLRLFWPSLFFSAYSAKSLVKTYQLEKNWKRSSNREKAV